jgi:hypothetical protein
MAESMAAHLKSMGFVSMEERAEAPTQGQAAWSLHRVRTAAWFLARNKVVIGGLGQPKTPPCHWHGLRSFVLPRELHWTCWNAVRYKARGDDQYVRVCTNVACLLYLACIAGTESLS